MSFLAAFDLVVPNSPLQPMWRVNPDGHRAFLAWGAWGVALLAVLCAACATTAVGLWRLAPWGRRLAIAILTLNLLGDTLNALVRGDLRTWLGLPIGGALIAYLASRSVRERFAPVVTGREFS